MVIYTRGCNQSFVLQLSSKPKNKYFFLQINVNCFGESNGFITTNTSNETGPGAYTIDFINNSDL